MKRINYTSIKYMLDRPLAVILLVISMPFILIFAVLAAIELRAFPFIIQDRGVTFNNGRVRICKFRTMRKHSTNKTNDVRNVFEKYYLENYVPPFCKWLRQSGLDELPQLLNVIIGDMSLVGPRPFTFADLGIIQKQNFKLYEKLDKLTAKPGITGYWQVHGNRTQGVPNMVWLQNYYEMHVSFILDMKIFLATLPLIILGQHSDAIVINEFENKKGFYVRSFIDS